MDKTLEYEFNLKPFLSGSRVYGGFDEDSDWDVVITFKDSILIRRILTLLNIETTSVSSSHETSFYVVLNNKKINFIEVDDIEMQSWRYATKCLSGMGIIADKDERVEKFRQKRSEFMDSFEKYF